MTAHLQISHELEEEMRDSFCSTKLPVVLLLLAAALQFPAFLHAGEERKEALSSATDAAATEENTRRCMEVAMGWAKEYWLTPLGKPQDQFRLVADPVFRHGVTGRVGDSGRFAVGPVVLWVTPDGRPAAIADLFVYLARPGVHGSFHEFHSLCDQPIVAQRKDKVRKVDQPGWDWKPVPKAPAVAESAAARLRQMRELGSRFHAHGIAYDGKGRWQYRMISRPIYRYEPKGNPSVLDGAILLFCEGTDPEILIGVEARKTDQGTQWFYAVASLSDFETRVQLDDAEVWMGRQGVCWGESGPHWSWFFGEFVLPPGTKKP